MKIIKSAWLEIVFGLIIAIIIALSVKNSIHEIQVDYGKNLQQGNVEMGIVGMDQYLDEIKELSNCTAIIVVKDISGPFTTSEIIDGLASLGFDQADALADGEYHSFIGIWSAGEVVFQQIGGDEAITYGQFLGKHYLYAKSATWTSGNTGDIYIDDVSYSVNNRGFNIVTIDNQNDTLIDSVAYDVYVEGIPLYRLVNGNATWVDFSIKE